LIEWQKLLLDLERVALRESFQCVQNSQCFGSFQGLGFLDGALEEEVPIPTGTQECIAPKGRNKKCIGLQRHTLEHYLILVQSNFYPLRKGQCIDYLYTKDIPK